MLTRIAVALLLTVFGGVATAYAQQQPPVTISSTSGMPLLVDGLASDKLPIGIGLGHQICVPSARTYASEGERYNFLQWSDGTTDRCIIADTPTEYRAMYSHEILLTIKSDVASTQQTRWVEAGLPLRLTVPTIAQDGPDTRYLFQSWNAGENPFTNDNTIAPMKPTTLEVKWIRQHQITVDGPDGSNIQGTGWYTDGTNLVLRAPDTLPGDNDQQRWKFSTWTSDSFPAPTIQNPQTASTSIRVDAGYAVHATYTRQYLVDAKSPFGSLKHDWFNDGDTLTLETPATSDVVQDQERLVFKRWDGIDGMLSPKITGRVDKPLSLTAVYDRQAMLKVNAPYGASGEGWQVVGSVVSVSVPSSNSQMFLMNSTFTGFNGYPAGQNSIQVLVNEPTTLTALYRTEPNLSVLALLLSLPLLAVLVYLGVTRGWFLDWKARVDARLRLIRARRRIAAAAEQREIELAAADYSEHNVSLPIGEEPRH